MTTSGVLFLILNELMKSSFALAVILLIIAIHVTLSDSVQRKYFNKFMLRTLATVCEWRFDNTFESVNSGCNATSFYGSGNFSYATDPYYNKFAIDITNVTCDISFF